MSDFEKLKDKLIKAQSSEEVEIVKSEIFGKKKVVECRKLLKKA